MCFIVTLPELGGKVYEAQQNSDGSWNYEALFNLDSAMRPLGITIYPSSLGPIVYVVGFNDESVSKMYLYSMDSKNNEWKQFLSEDLPANSNVTGVTLLNDEFYMVDAENDTVYVYKYHERLDWWHNQSRDFKLDSDNSGPSGIIYANNRFYVVDYEDDKVYAYTSSGQRDATADFDLDSDNSAPSGITYANNRLYVVNGNDTTIYEYEPPDLAKDLDALVSLYENTNPGLVDPNEPGWTNSLNWLSNNPLGEWYGVGINAQGRVDSLNLADNMLKGTLPEELGNLTNLTYLDLRRNQLRGSIPSALGNLTQLQILALHENQLSGPIPAELGNLTNLTTELNLSRNQLTGTIPASLGNLTKLKKLYLYENQLRGPIPLTFRNLTNLEHLGLGNNAGLCLPAALQTWAASRQLSDAQNLPACSPVTDVNIPDANLRAVIADSLGKTSGEAITTAEMATLTSLVAHNKGIRDLTGLEHATNLEVLNLDDNSISDISALSGLTNLIELYLYSTSLGSTSISDISALSGLTNLTHLVLYSTGISDISALSGLTNLTHLFLFLYSTGISDISALSGLTNLTHLFLSSHSISDISALSGLTNLTHLFLSSHSISDISALSGLTNLTRLVLSSHSISDISALSGLTNLIELDLYNTIISDMSVLSGLTNLTHLVLSSHSISDISALSGLMNLTHLDLYSHSISDISALSGLTNLIELELYLYLPGISDISALSGLMNLTRLVLYSPRISDISALSGLTSLQWLSLVANSISDLAPLVANTGLGNGDEVDVRHNPLSATSINTHIPALQARGVTVFYGTSKPAVEVKEMPMPRAAIEMFGDDAWRRDGSVALRRMADKGR